MKKLTLSLAAVAAMGTFAVAGGDIAPVEPAVETPVETPVVAPVTDAGFYVGGGYSLLSSDSKIKLDNNSDLGADYSALMLQAGYKVNQYVAVEGRYWIGLSDKAFDLDNIGLSRFDHNADAWGIYVKPMYPVTDALDVYALLGYASATAKGITLRDGSSFDMDADGFSWGLGVAYSFTDNWSVFFDYVDFQDDTITNTARNGKEFTFDHAFASWNFGVTYKF